MEMSNANLERTNGIMHVDFDKNNQIFYNNIYFKENNVVLKMPLINMRDNGIQDDIKLEKFDVTKYVYIIHYD